MKTINFYGILTLCLAGILFFSCAGSNNPSETPSTTSVKNKISENDFNTWVANWKSEGLQFSTKTLPESFILPKVDLIEVLAEPGVAATRFYIGLDKSHAVDSLHLIVVGVNKYGNDMIDYNNNLFAYDVSRLCPIFCTGGNGYPANLEN